MNLIFYGGVNEISRKNFNVLIIMNKNPKFILLSDEN